MPQEYIPRHEYVTSTSKTFEVLIELLDIAEKNNWSERLLSDVLKNWGMPNEPLLSEN